MNHLADNEYSVYFRNFLNRISNTNITKENVKKAFLELKSSISEWSDKILFEIVLRFLEKVIEKEDSLPIKNNSTRLISLKIKIFKKNPSTEKYRLVYGYLTSIAAETLGNLFIQSDRVMDYIGIELEKGNITVKNGGDFVGVRMSGGNIHILGDTGMYAGQKMSGGSIKIEGVAGAFLGDGIIGGKIEARMADETANRNKNVIVEKYIDIFYQKARLISKDEIKKYVKDACKKIYEWEKRKNINLKIEKNMIVNVDIGTVSKNNEAVNKELFFEQNNNMLMLTDIMQEVYGEVDIKRIEEVDYIEGNTRKNENNVRIFVMGQKEKEENKYRDENFERLRQLFKYKEPNKEEILRLNLSVDEIKKILNNVDSLTVSEKMIIGYLTSIAAEKLAIRGETLFIEKKFDYIGMEMRNGKIVVKNAGEYLGKNMRGGEIKVEGDVLGNVGEGMVDGKIEIAGHVYGDYVGWRMEGGKILIKGSCRNFVGLKMLGGEIIVEKSAGNWVGKRMEGGEILIKGRCGVVGKDMKNGIIRIKEGIISHEREGGEIYTL